MIITITGTPGSGKTSIAKKIAKECKDLKYIDLNAIIKKEKLYDSYDRLAKTYDVDVKKLEAFNSQFSKFKDKKTEFSKLKKEYDMIGIIKKLKRINGIIVDSHLSHYLKSDICIVVKTDIKTINTRLKKRNYSKQKIKDNIESEIFDICLNEAEDLKRKIVVINNG